MDWMNSKAAIASGCFALIALQTYGWMSVRSSVDQRIGSFEQQVRSMRTEDEARISQLSSALEAVTQHMGITSHELQEAHAIAEKLKQENTQTAQRLRKELAAKADTRALSQFHEEAAMKLAEVQQDTTAKFGVVSGEVQGVRTDLDATRLELAGSKQELSNQIAHNSSELAELRRRGEREYVEFDMNKSKEFAQIADVRVQLRKTDVKHQKFDVVIQADDVSMTRKDRTANEPVTFFVGPDRLRYELVVNYVQKDRVRGYLSTPKDKTLSAEGPSSHPLP